MSVMRVLLSARAQSLMSLSMAPHSRIYSSGVLTNSLSVLNPTNSCAVLVPLSTAGVSLEIVAVETASLQRITLHAEKLELQC
jgi:hypothetical protein